MNRSRKSLVQFVVSGFILLSAFSGVAWSPDHVLAEYTNCTGVVDWYDQELAILDQSDTISKSPTEVTSADEAKQDEEVLDDIYQQLRANYPPAPARPLHEAILKFVSTASFQFSLAATALQDGGIFLPLPGPDPLDAAADAMQTEADALWSICPSSKLEPFWRFDTVSDGGNRSLSELVIVDGVVYVGSGARAIGKPRQAYAAALDAYSGAVKWTVEFEERSVWEQPVVVDGVVYVVAGGQQVYALDAADGSERWRFDTSSKAIGDINGAPAVADGTVAVATGGTVIGLDATAGKPVWSAKPTAGDAWHAYATGDAILAKTSTEAGIAAFDPRTGAERWFVALADAGDLLEANGTLFAVTERSTVSAVDGTDGQIIWSQQINDSQIWQLEAEGEIVVARGASGLFAMNATTGEPLWGVYSQSYDGFCISQGSLYAYSSTLRFIIKVEMQTGTIDWSNDIDFGGSSSPVVADGIFYLVGLDDNGVVGLHAIRLG